MATQKINYDRLVTLREYAEGMQNGFIACSENIDSSGLIRVDSVDADWWVRNNDCNGGNGRTFSCHPNTHVYIINKTPKA